MIRTVSVKLKRYKDQISKFAVGLVLGATLGYAWYYFVGCRSGVCAITSDPVNASIYGALLGGIWTLPNGRKSKTITPPDSAGKGQKTKGEPSI